MQPLIYVLVFLAVLMAIEGVFLLSASLRRLPRQRAVRRRLRDLRAQAQSRVQERGSILRTRMRKRRTGIARLIDWLPRRQSFETLFQRAGNPMSLERFMVLSLGVGAAGFALGWHVLRNPGLAVVLSGLAFVPYLVMLDRKRRRMKKFNENLPQALELFTRALRAGHSLSFGFQMVGQELPDPVGTEFAQVADEIAMGQDMRAALANLSERVDCPSLPFFVTSVQIQRETGGNLGEILDNLGAVIRQRINFQGKVRALTAQTRFSANILLIVPVAWVALLFVVYPTYVQPLWETDGGRLLCMISAVMVVIGYVLCRRFGIVRA